MIIELTNNKCRLIAKPKTLIELRKNPNFQAKMPGAFFSPAYRSGRWDGYVRYINEKGVFDSGKLVHVIEALKDYDIDIDDQRPQQIKAHTIPQQLNGTKLRKYQFDAVKSIKYNKVNGILFPRGILDMATNAGKTIISAAIFETFAQPTVFYVKSKELYGQAIRDLSSFIPGRIGYISATDGESWNDFMVVMVPSVIARMDTLGPKLAKFKVVLVDECDETDSKSYKAVLKYTFNAYIKIGLSGSVFTDKRAKKKIKYENMRAQFGEVLYKIGNTELMKQGFSSWVDVTIHQGNTRHKYPGEYDREYLNGIILSGERNQRIQGITLQAHNTKKFPILIMVKNHKHIKKLMGLFKTWPFKIDWVHHERKDRDDVVERFAKGEIDILVGSYILKRGKNFPLVKTLIMAAGGDSMENVLQVLGRATRKSATKDRTDLHDFYDRGEYLRRHSYHRLIVYKNEGLKITEVYDKKLLS